MALTEETIRLANGMRVQIGADVDVVERRLIREWARAWDALYETFADAAMDLAQAGLDGRWPSPWIVSRSRKAEKALAAALDSLYELTDFTKAELIDAVGKTAAYSAEHEVRIIASQLPQIHYGYIAGLVGFERVDRAAIDAIVERATQQITATSWPLAQRAQNELRRVLVQGVAVGENPRKAARTVLRRLEGAFNGGLNRALTITRTEMLDAYRSAAALTDISHADVITGWIWSATLDTRTCSSCIVMHGTEHNLEETGPNDHQNGRCGRIPKTVSWADLGFPDIEEPPSVLPDSRAWFDGLTEDDQRRILGPTKLAMLNDGLIGWGDLATLRSTDGWRDSWVPTPVRDLLATRR